MNCPKCNQEDFGRYTVKENKPICINCFYSPGGKPNIKDLLKQLLKDNLEIKLAKRYNGASYISGTKISLCFDSEELCYFYLWDNEEITIDFFDEDSQKRV